MAPGTGHVLQKQCQARVAYACRMGRRIFSHASSFPNKALSLSLSLPVSICLSACLSRSLARSLAPGPPTGTPLQVLFWNRVLSALAPKATSHKLCPSGFKTLLTQTPSPSHTHTPTLSLPLSEFLPRTKSHVPVLSIREAR